MSSRRRKPNGGIPYNDDLPSHYPEPSTSGKRSREESSSPEPSNHYTGRSFKFKDMMGPENAWKPAARSGLEGDRWTKYNLCAEEREVLHKIHNGSLAFEELIPYFSEEEIAIISATGPNYDPPPLRDPLQILSMKVRRKDAKYKIPNVVPFYFYSSHEDGRHLPRRIDFRMFDEAFTYAECPELRAILDDRQFTIEFWHEDGTFRRLDPITPLNCRYRRRLMIFRPGNQPRNYVQQCVGLRELSYELFLSNTGIPHVPIKNGIAPAASWDMLNVDHTWALARVEWPFEDVEFARGNTGIWETGSDYESDSPQENEVSPILLRTKKHKKKYNDILRLCPRFGWFAGRLEDDERMEEDDTLIGCYKTDFENMDMSRFGRLDIELGDLIDPAQELLKSL